MKIINYRLGRVLITIGMNVGAHSWLWHLSSSLPKELAKEKEACILVGSFESIARLN